MTITIEEIKEAFEVAFGNCPTPLEPMSSALSDEIFGFLDSKGDEIISINKYGVSCAVFEFRSYSEMPTLIAEIPAMIGMLLDLHAENERLKADNERIE